MTPPSTSPNRRLPQDCGCEDQDQSNTTGDQTHAGRTSEQTNQNAVPSSTGSMLAETATPIGITKTIPTAARCAMYNTANFRLPTSRKGYAPTA